MKNLTQMQENSQSLVVYGFGTTGQHMVDALLQQQMKIDCIIDQNKGGSTYKSIPILNLKNFKHQHNQLNHVYCLIALHNHYIDLREVYQQLLPCHFKRILTLQQLEAIARNITLPNGYWLDFNFDYAAHHQAIDAFITLLSDEKSQLLAKQIIRYRTFGHIEDYPAPSLVDEYTPHDIPRYQAPLRVIDCGAFNGVAIEKLLHAGYTIDAFVAFEPDSENFTQLSSKSFNVKQSTCLPLGVWSSNTQLRFNSSANMGSSINQHGETMIQCVRVDDVLNHFAPNLIKLDVEGAEIEAILGLKKTINTDRPNLAISVYHLASHLFEIALLINQWNLGYQFYLRVHEHNTFGVVLYCLQDKLISKAV